MLTTHIVTREYPGNTLYAGNYMGPCERLQTMRENIFGENSDSAFILLYCGGGAPMTLFFLFFFKGNSDVAIKFGSVAWQWNDTVADKQEKKRGKPRLQRDLTESSAHETKTG